MEKYKFDLDMRTKDMFSFMMYQQYSGFKGFVVLFINALVIFCLVTRWSTYDDAPRLLLVFVLFLFDIYMPLQLLLRAKNQVVAAGRFKGATHYEIDDEGMLVSKEGEELKFKWPHFLKYKTISGRAFVYTSRITAFVFPKELIGGEAYSFMLEKLRENRGILGSMSLDSVEHTNNKEDSNGQAASENED